MFMSRLCRNIRCYSVGKPFKSLDEVKQYLSESSWSIADMLETPASKTEAVKGTPTDAEVKQLLALSGFPIKGTDIEDIKLKLIKQLSFINTLHNTPVDDKNLNENYARLLPRQNIPLTYDSLLQNIKKIKQEEETGEVFDSWDATSLSQTSKDHFFVVKQGLLKDRK